MDLGRIDARFSSLVDAARLREGDAFRLAFSADIRFEFREDTQHVEERCAGGRARVDRLLPSCQGYAIGLQLVDYVLQILDLARESVLVRSL